MLLGIDLGTTRTLVAAADRGNFPVVGFLDDDGELHEHLPSVVAGGAGRRVLSTGSTPSPPPRTVRRSSARSSGCSPAATSMATSRCGLAKSSCPCWSC
jgi:hypothetical protein